jgi:hypothetical protein
MHPKLCGVNLIGPIRLIGSPRKYYYGFLTALFWPAKQLDDLLADGQQNEKEGRKECGENTIVSQSHSKHAPINHEGMLAKQSKLRPGRLGWP